jgi:predicted acylesterase/phospholipase RssA
MKLIGLVLLLALQFGCQTSSRKEEHPPVPPALSPSAPKQEPNREALSQVPSLSTPTPLPSNGEIPKTSFEKAKLAIILGPGGLRAYAHAGVLQEIHRAKINLVGIGGLEMGALPAALYAMKPQAFEAEWQMMKLKEEDFSERGIISGTKAKDLSSWDTYLKTVFGSGRFEDARIPFGCITVQMDRQQAMVVSKGVVAQTLPSCLAFPPLFKPVDRFVAGTDQLSALVQHFRQKGATHILYVDLLADRSKPLSKNEDISILWSLMSASLQAQAGYTQESLRISLNGDLNQFSQRREMIQKGKEASGRSLNNLLQKLGAY